MTEEEARARLVRYWWDMGQASLQAARRELAAGAYAFAIKRSYYALFYAVSALLLEGGRQFRRLSGVRTAFNRDFIRTGRVQERFGDLYNQLFDDRQAGDYVALIEFDAQDVEDKIEACADCLTQLRPLLKSLPPMTTERDKIIQDLRHAGQLSQVAWIEQFHQVVQGYNDGGDPYSTDGRLAVGVIVP